jgi:hypothetical protein
LGDVRGPQLRHLAERPDGSVALWLEDISASVSWDAERLAEVVQRIAGAKDPPDGPWLSRGWFRSYITRRASLLATGGAAGAILAADADDVLDHLDRAPQVFCHFDLHPGNVRGVAGDVVIDWAYCGIGAAGLDAGVLALDALFDGVVPVQEGRAVLAAVWGGYAAGLRDRGLPLEEVHWAFLAGAALRLSWIPGFLAQGLGTPEQQIRFRELVPLLLELATEARACAPSALH